MAQEQEHHRRQSSQRQEREGQKEGRHKRCPFQAINQETAHVPLLNAQPCLEVDERVDAVGTEETMRFPGLPEADQREIL